MRIFAFAPAAVLLASTLVAQPAPPAAKKAPAGPGLALATSAFSDGDIIPAKYTQSVESPVSPKLEWTNVPPGTVGFVLLMHDPDAAPQRKVSDVLHWLAINIPGTARGLPEAVPAEAKLADGTLQAKNVRGMVGYLGPGAGAAGPYHHYTWELFALDTTLELTADATRDEVLKAMDGHVLGKGVLVGRFHR